jgi:hypothetical protein
VRPMEKSERQGRARDWLQLRVAAACLRENVKASKLEAIWRPANHPLKARRYSLE